MAVNASAIVTAMEPIRSYFNKFKTIQSREQIVSGLYGQIAFLAIGCFNMGLGIAILAREIKRGDPFGTVVSFKVLVATSFLMVLSSAFWIRKSVRGLLAAPAPDV